MDWTKSQDLKISPSLAVIRMAQDLIAKLLTAWQRPLVLQA